MNAYRASIDPLEALGDATRRAIVARLREGESSVGALAAGLPVSRPAVSQHLGVLRAAGLVVERPAGTRRFYRLSADALAVLHARIDAMWGVSSGELSPGGEPAALGEQVPTPTLPPLPGPTAARERRAAAGRNAAREPRAAQAAPEKRAEAPLPAAPPASPVTGHPDGAKGHKKHKKKANRR